MSFFSQLFSRKLSRSETESLLDEIERYSRLPSPLPAMARLETLAPKVPRSLIGPGGPLHDRFIAIGQALVKRVGSRPDEIVRIAPAWDSLPSVLHGSVDFTGNVISPAPSSLIKALEDETKEFVAFSNANSNVRERDPGRQMRIFFDFIDHPRWSLILLIFSGSLVVRSRVIRDHPSSLNLANLQDLVPTLCSAASHEGAVKVFR